MKVQTSREPPADEELERRTLQRLANQVRDEQHWADILSKATPSQRDELERKIGTKLRFRRGLPCMSPECESGQPAVWQPSLECRSPFPSEGPSWAPIERTYCETCKGEAELADFLTDAIWAQVLHGWNPDLAPPVKRLTTLKWDRVH